jgi:hypothetical protein
MMIAVGWLIGLWMGLWIGYRCCLALSRAGYVD